MWGAAKEPLDAPLGFDAEGLALAFKYFNSSTLTMRLAGVAQINSHIAAHNELCAGEPAADAEIAGQQLASWLMDNSIIEHLFGPNLHVEVSFCYIWLYIMDEFSFYYISQWEVDGNVYLLPYIFSNLMLTKELKHHESH